MDEQTRIEVRQATERLRRPPGQTLSLRVHFDGDGKLDVKSGASPAEVTLEVTNAEGELAPWFNDFWWTEIIQRWGDEPLTIHIAPTPAALMHVVVLYQLEMVRRVAPTWRLVGHGFRDDLALDDAMAQAACAPFDEIRIIDATRRATTPADRCTFDAPIGEIFANIRREQNRIGAARPILVRLPSAQSVSGTRPNSLEAVRAREA